MKPVYLKMTFEDLFSTEASDEVRRQRWEDWKKIAISSGKKGKNAVAEWTDISSCYGCLDRDGDWCKLGLPCAVNPILSFRHGMPGMACMGLGFNPKISAKEQATLIDVAECKTR